MACAAVRAALDIPSKEPLREPLAAIRGKRDGIQRKNWATREGFAGQQDEANSADQGHSVCIATGRGLLAKNDKLGAAEL